MFTRTVDFLKQLFIYDQDKKQISHTKLLSVLSGFVILIMFPYAVIHGSQVGYEFWLVFAICLLGNRTVNKLVELKFGAKEEKPKKGEEA